MFQDRRDAGEQLAGAVAGSLREAAAPLVVAGLARGGVVVAAPVAAALGVPVYALVVRKIALPADPEFALGAVAAGGEAVWNPDVMRGPPAAGGMLGGRAQAARAEADALQARLGGDWMAKVEGAELVLVDDGLATGLSAVAAVARGRGLGARAVTLAVPVASGEGAALARAEADRLVCLAEPVGFRAVGAYFLDFAPVTEGDVLRALAP